MESSTTETQTPCDSDHVDSSNETLIDSIIQEEFFPEISNMAMFSNMPFFCGTNEHLVSMIYVRLLGSDIAINLGLIG